MATSDYVLSMQMTFKPDKIGKTREKWLSDIERVLVKIEFLFFSEIIFSAGSRRTTQTSYRVLGSIVLTVFDATKFLRSNQNFKPRWI